MNKAAKIITNFECKTANHKLNTTNRLLSQAQHIAGARPHWSLPLLLYRKTARRTFFPVCVMLSRAFPVCALSRSALPREGWRALSSASDVGWRNLHCVGSSILHHRLEKVRRAVFGYKRRPKLILVRGSEVAVGRYGVVKLVFGNLWKRQV